MSTGSVRTSSALLATASGASLITETIFENRFRHIEELLKMGANITVNGRTAVICGVPHLTGACVFAKELRGAGALVAAGLSALMNLPCAADKSSGGETVAQDAQVPDTQDAASLSAADKSSGDVRGGGK